jgi:hypothetical protein
VRYSCVSYETEISLGGASVTQAPASLSLRWDNPKIDGRHGTVSTGACTRGTVQCRMQVYTGIS